MNRFVRTWTMVAGLALGTSMVGCKDDPMLTARAMHATERADEAEGALKEVLAANPKDFEARRLMADVHRFRGDFARTESELQALWDEKGFGDEDKEFSQDDRAQRDLLENQFNELYAKWSQTLDSGKDPDTFEKVLRSGLVWKPKSPTLNRELVDYYMARGAALADEGKTLEAAEAYENVIQLRTMAAQRKEARDKAAALRADAFAETVKKRFDETVKAELIAMQQWDEAEKVVKLRVETDVDRRLRQSREEDLATARTQAGLPVRAVVASVVTKVTGLDSELAARTPVKLTSGEESLSRGKYGVTVVMTLEDLISAAYATKESARRAAEAEKKTAADDTAPGADAAATKEQADGGVPADEGGADAK